MLKLENISAGYQKVQVLHQISMSISESEITGVIGANGAGKSTLLKTIDGMLPCRSGSINYNGEEISTLPIHKRIELGITHVPEGCQIFAPLTVYENLLLGTYSKRRQLGRKREQLLSRVFALFPILDKRKKQLAGTLSGGERQMLAIARGLMAMPKLLLIDEPSLGLAPMIVRSLAEVFRKLNQEGVTLLLVEQNVAIAIEICHELYLLDLGRIVIKGKPAELCDKKEIQEIYLGGSRPNRDCYEKN